MPWQTQLQADPLPWLLDECGPGVRYLALRDLCDLPPDNPQLVAARRAAHRAGPIAAVLDQIDPDGFWVEPGPGYNPKYRATVWSVILLAQLGLEYDYAGKTWVDFGPKKQPNPWVTLRALRVLKAIG